MDIIEIGTNLIQEKFGINIDSSTISEALTTLLGGKGGEIDLQALISQFMEGGGLENIVQSWLGDGSNNLISADQIGAILGNSKITDFASKLGIDSSQATEGLSEIIPQLIDKASSGGSLLDGLDVSSVLGMAKKFF